MEQKEATIVNITDNAAEKVKTLMAQEGEEDLALRIGVRPGGCSGFQYSIYFDDEIADDDEVFETKGVRVLVDRKSTRLNSSHANISYAVFCLKKKKHTMSYIVYAI